jgi:tetratricopeptide (TPR) repeat protein
MGQLSREVRGRLRGLTKENAERIGLHLVMAGRLLDVDPERAYEHAQAAVRRGGRVDVVREAAGIAAYRTGRFAEALRELRTVRRLNGSSEHLPLMADAERGLGRPERALALAASEEARTLDAEGRTELAIVASGARSDLGEHDAALAVLDRIPAAERRGDLGLRVLQARAAALESAGRTADAAQILAGVDPAALERASGVPQDADDVVVYDTYDEDADEDTAPAEPAEPTEPTEPTEPDDGPIDDVATEESRDDAAKAAGGETDGALDSNGSDDSDHSDGDVSDDTDDEAVASEPGAQDSAEPKSDGTKERAEQGEETA